MSPHFLETVMRINRVAAALATLALSGMTSAASFCPPQQLGAKR
ncbi:hypothetical protein Lcho_3480 [Leptothrix cholodnii SP-6]|uniref:Uncharacterized protein n=1 Tax=Leptothrix cholodnii (strain ATCC 51168 / LMG 8142 / SP-6) TaxID=395495 RepID=B1Y3N3_LEPCP|nr:hypothetical protein Lcho_3480 [Leptothrix cholodnii SP-6]